MLAVAAFLLAAEIAAGWLLWQHTKPGRSAATTLAGLMPRAWQRVTAPAPASSLPACVTHDAVLRAVFASSERQSAEGAAVRREVEARYRAAFEALLRTAQRRGAAVAMFYPHMAGVPDGRGRSVFEALARDYALPLIRPVMPAGLDAADLFLLPVDPHPSRLGHRLMADALRPVLEDLSDHRAAPVPSRAQAERLGGLPPGLDEIVTTVPAYPYRLRTNAQGLRMEEPIPANAERQVVLLLGDSFTYGTPLNGPDTYAARLAAALPDRIVVNAGVAGTGIAEARFLLETRWSGTRSDVVVVQVLDNDIEALLWTAPAPWFMRRPPRAPTDAERALQSALAKLCRG